MKLLLVSNYASDRQYSMLGFAECLAREFPKLGIQPTILAPTAKYGNRGKSAKVRKWLAYLDKYVIFPKTLKREAAKHDLVHVLDHGNAMYVPHLQSVPHLVTCHDMLAIRASLGEIPEWRLGPTGLKYQALILAGLKQSRFIAAVSGATAEDVYRLTGLPKDRVSTIYNGFYQELNPVSEDRIQAILSENGITRPFILHVGGDSPYKNRLGLIKIYQHLLEAMPDAPNLVLAGRKPSAEVSAMLDQLPQDKVKRILSPETESLTALYQAAQALIFPSTHEGFGLPIIEAQALECPVFTSNRAPMTEVGGDAAIYFDPCDSQQAATVIQNGIAETERMKSKGKENVRRFSSAAMAQSYVNLYQEILGVAKS